MTPQAAARPKQTSLPGGTLLGLRNIYIFPTGSGWIFLGTMFLLLLCAINYNSNLLHAMVFFFSGLFFVSLMQAYRTIWGLRLEPGPPPQNTFVGEDINYFFTVRNDSSEYKHDISAEMRLDGTKKVKVASCEPRSLPNDSSNTISIAVPATQRGWMTLGSIKLGTIYPLGLFQAWTIWHIKQRTLVYPAVAGTKPLPHSENLSDEEEGGARTRGYDQFEGLKPYYPGAPLRDIHWKKSMQEDIFIRDFSGYDSQVWMLNLNHTSGINDMEEKLSQLCMWIMMLQAENQRYGLVLPGKHIKPGSGGEHDRSCLAALALQEVT